MGYGSPGEGGGGSFGRGGHTGESPGMGSPGPDAGMGGYGGDDSYGRSALTYHDPSPTKGLGISEEDLNALIDKRLAEGGYKSPSERQQAGLDAGRAGIERFKVAYDNINAQFGAHWKEVFGKNFLGTEARAKDLGVEYKSEGALSEKIKKTVQNTVDLGFKDASDAYLEANPDITRQSWKNKSAWDHYTMYGEAEGRKWPGEKKDA